MSDPVIETRGLTKTFDGTAAVDRLDLIVGRGEMFGLVGPDGAGKTTTIRLLCGILAADSGTALVLGRDMGLERGEIKSRIGYLSQRFSLYGDLTIDENIEFFAEIHGVGDLGPRREELLEFTRLKPFRRRLAERLSGGMKQKLALACTLIHTPEILMLDEPTTGVDPVSRRDFWTILADLVRKGVTILLATPYMDEAERCDRVGLLSAGRLAAVDTPAGLKKLFKDPILEVITDENRRAAKLLRGLPAVKDVQLFGDRMNVVATGADADGEIGRALAGAGIRAIGIKRISPSLENVFLSMAGSSNLEAKK